MDGREVVVTLREMAVDINLVLGYFANTISKPSSCIHTSLQSSLTPMVMVEVMMMMLFLFGFIIPLFLFGAYADVFSCMAFYMHACFLDAV